MLAEEAQHPCPGLFRRISVINFRTVAVEECVADAFHPMKLVRLAQIVQLNINRIHHVRRRDVVVVAEKSEHGSLQIAEDWVDVGMDTVEVDAGSNLLIDRRSIHRKLPSHAEAHDANLTALDRILRKQGIHRTLDHSLGVPNVEGHEHRTRFVRLGRLDAMIKVGRKSRETGGCEAIRDIFDMADQPPPLLDHDDARPLARRARRKIARVRLAIAAEFNHSHVMQFDARGAAVSLLCALIVLGCARPQTPSSAPQALTPGVVGEIGASKPYLDAGRTSIPLEPDGLPASSSLVYADGVVDGSPEEKIKPLMISLRPEISFNGMHWDLARAQGYSQLLDYKTSVITTIWTDPMLGEFKVTAHPEAGNVLAKFEIEFKSSSNGELLVSKQTAKPLPPEFIPRGHIIQVEAGDGFDEQDGQYSAAYLPGETRSFSVTFRTHKLTPVVERDAPAIELDGPEEDEQIIASLQHQLEFVGKGPGGLGPFATTSDRYFGHVFWDADAWVLPALALTRPEQAAAIPRYRLQTQPGMLANFEEWVREKNPRNGLIAPKPKVAWESSKSGKETAVGDSRHQEHISATVAHSLLQSAALGLIESKPAHSFAENTASYFSLRVVQTPRGWEMKDVMSPDEYHIGNNDLYTNLAVQSLFDRSGINRKLALP